MLENAGALVVVLDRQGRIRRFNRSSEELSQYRSEEVLGRYVWDLLLPPEEIEAVQAVFAQLETTTLPNNYTNHWVARDKSRHLIHWSNVVMTDDQGAYDYLISIGVDVTEQTRAQHSLAERSELMERIFENTHTLIAYMDTDFNFIRVNHAYAAVDNKTEAQFVGLNHFDLYPNADNEQIFRQVVATGKPHFSYAKAFEYEYSPEIGITHWDWSLSPISNEHGEIVAVLLVLADVSERIRAEEALRRNEAVMNTAQAIAHFGSWDWDILTGQLAWSDEIYRIFGQPPQSFPATYDAFLETIHPDDRDKVARAVNASVADAAVEYNVEHRIVRLDGEIRDVHEQGEVYRDEHGRALRMIGTVHDITVRKQAERELMLQELAMQHSISAIAMADLQGRLTYVNQAFLDIWGYAHQAEVLGRPVLDFWKHPEQTLGMIQELKSAGRWIGEMDALSRDGQVMCIRVSANITMDESGQPLNMMASFVDVSEQRSTEKSLRLNQELLSKAQEIAHVGSWDWSITNDDIKWSDETYRIFGRKAGEFAENYRDFLRCVHADDRDFVDATVKDCLAEPGRTYHLEHRIVRPSGEIRSVLEQGVIYRDENGKPVRMVGSVLDITERKQFIDELQSYREHLEELVKERTEEVERQHKQNTMIVNAAMDGFFITDTQARFRDCNHAYEEMLGYSKAEILQLKIPDVEVNESPEEVQRHIEKLLQDGVDRFDTKHRGKDGRIIDVEVNVSVTRLDNEDLFFAFVHDISDRKRAEAEILKARDEAEHANKLKSEFLGRISHELRTPMNAILGFGQLMEEEKLSEEQKAFMHEIMHAGRHLMGLIDEVLDLAKVETGKIDIRASPVRAAVRPARADHQAWVGDAPCIP
ncbi:MAG: PAS domain S-box protein [Gammaproteobacteria bacterium]